MKIEQKKVGFQPIVITLETEQDYRDFMGMVNFVRVHSSVDSFVDRVAIQYKEALTEKVSV